MAMTGEGVTMIRIEFDGGAVVCNYGKGARGPPCDHTFFHSKFKTRWVGFVHPRSHGNRNLVRAIGMNAE